MALFARYIGAAALLAVGLDHLEQRTAAHYAAIPTIGTLFLAELRVGDGRSRRARACRSNG